MRGDCLPLWGTGRPAKNNTEQHRMGLLRNKKTDSVYTQLTIYFGTKYVHVMKLQAGCVIARRAHFARRGNLNASREFDR